VGVGDFSHLALCGGGCGWLGGWRSGGLCATRGQTDIRGLGTAGPGFVVRARRLLWRAVCQAAQHLMPAAVAGISVGWRGGRAPDWCATRGQTLMRGCTGLALVSAGPVFVVRARYLGSDGTARGCERLFIDRSRMLSRERQAPAASSADVVRRAVSRRSRSPSRTRRARGRQRLRRSCGACRAWSRGAATRGRAAAALSRRAR
jgi:hypothetical protein